MNPITIVVTMTARIDTGLTHQELLDSPNWWAAFQENMGGAEGIAANCDSLQITGMKLEETKE